MIENNPTNVEAAFEMLLEEIEAEIDFVTNIGSRSFEKRDFDRAREALEHAGKLTAFRDKMASLRKEWTSISALEVDEEEQKERTDRQNLGRLQRGVRTREEAYFKPILQALDEMEGTGQVKDVLDRVGEIMKSVLKDVDYEPLASSPDNHRWRNAAQWARNSMVNEGLLKNESPRGVWEITDTGRKFVSDQENSIENGRDIPPESVIVICRGQDAYAEGSYANNKLTVFSGSKCRMKETPSMPSSSSNKRKKLLNKGVLIKSGKSYTFTSNYTFPSPGSAAEAVLGRSAYGWKEWKSKKGQILKSIMKC